MNVSRWRAIIWQFIGKLEDCFWFCLIFAPIHVREQGSLRVSNDDSRGWESSQKWRRTVKLIPCAAAAALILSATLASAASAQDDTAPEARVSYADLNLNSDAGLKALNHRINAAIRVVCGDGRFGPAPLAEQAARNRCSAAARQSADSDLASVLARAKDGTAVAQAGLAVVRQ